MRSFILIAAATLALGSASIVSAAPGAAPTGPYKLDAAGRCHAANGQLAAGALCKMVAAKCKTGVPCGAACIPKGAVCHK